MVVSCWIPFKAKNKSLKDTRLYLYQVTSQTNIRSGTPAHPVDEVLVRYLPQGVTVILTVEGQNPSCTYESLE